VSLHLSSREEILKTSHAKPLNSSVCRLLMQALCLHHRVACSESHFVFKLPTLSLSASSFLTKSCSTVAESWNVTKHQLSWS